MICKNCQKEIKDNAKFCNFCGEKVIHIEIKEGLFKGRLNRRNYFIGNILIYLIFFSIYFVWGVISAIFGFTSDNNLQELLIFIGSILWLIYSLSLSIRRLHDLNNSGWVILAGLIPLVNFALVLMLLFKRGDISNNKYGTKPLSKIEIRKIFGLNSKI